MTKRTFRWFLKVVFSGMLALVVLHVFCLFYYNLPIHFSGEEGATDYIWESNFSYSNLTEGYGRGKTNNEGYVNPFDYADGMETDILLMGSSHMEAFQLKMDESAAAQLRRLCPGNSVYNLGTSGHDFLVCANNLSSAVKKYQPKKFVVVETAAIHFSEEAIGAVLEGTAQRIPSYSDGLLGMLQRNKYFCLLYKQLLARPVLINPPANPFADKAAEVVKQEPKKQADLEISESMYALLQKMKKDVEVSGAELIIVYHPFLSVRPDASAAASVNRVQAQLFSEACQELGIRYLNMADRFLEEYEKNHVLPHGFFNSSVGNGHLNRYGHAMIAEELCSIISEVE